MIIITLSVYSAERVIFLPNDTVKQISMEDASTIIELDQSDKEQVKFKKLKVVLLTIFLGHFGVHRIYLGTMPNVPVVYSLTLGGGLGILPLIDLFTILFSKDLNQFENNDRVIMWNRE